MKWNQISDLPFDIWGGHRRTGMASFVINNIAYLAGGAYNTGDIDAWSYSSNSDSWEQIADFPVINKESVGFQINGLGYVTGGGWGSKYNKSWYILQIIILGMKVTVSFKQEVGIFLLY